MFPERQRATQSSDRARALHLKDRSLVRHLPYVVEVDDEVMRTRENALMMSLEVAGMDGITSAPLAIAALRTQLAQLLDGLDERFTFYVHRLMRKAAPGLKPLMGTSFAADAETAWRAHLETRSLLEPLLVVTVVRSLTAPIKVPLFRSKAASVFGGDTARRTEELREVVSILETGLGIGTRRLKVSDGALIGFYAALTSGELTPVSRGSHTLVAEDAASAVVTFGKGYVALTDGAGETRYAAVLHIRSYATAT